MGRGLRGTQSDGRKPVGHIVTGIVAVAVSIGVPFFTHLNQGPAGPAGKPATSVSSGVCAYFGKDSSGNTRFQVFTPGPGGTCSEGHFVSVVVPGR